MKLMLSKNEAEVVREALEISKVILSREGLHACNCVLSRMELTDDIDTDIKKKILDYIKETEQTEIRYVLAFCVGYFGCVDMEILNVILDLYFDKVIK